VIEALVESARRPDVRGYAPIRGLAARRRHDHARPLPRRLRRRADPEREVALIPGTKTGIVELAEVLADDGDTILLPDRTTPTPVGARASPARRWNVPARPLRRLGARP
jgi:aspartate/methionine/tyrosine aminotransferase